MEIRYDNINTLTEVQFVAGTDQVFTFTVYDENGGLKDISGSTCTWKMSAYGIPNVVELSKTGTLISTNSFKITLLPIDTVTLSGKYIHQPMVTLLDGSVYIPSQGLITITPKIQ